MSLPVEVKNVHFIGIGGYGMSALAQILLQKGYRVSGSDLKSSPLTDSLAASGATIVIGHSAANLGPAELVVYSTAVPPGNPELVETKKRGLSLWHRSELLAALLNNSYGIAIAGAHGKTTTTAMVALLLEAGGLDPTAVIGGVLPAYESNARLGNSPYLVAEADESDSSFTRYYPRLALVTGIEPDHLEHYGNDYVLLQQAYRNFLANLPAVGLAVLCSDDHLLRNFGSKLHCPVIYYGLHNDLSQRPDYYAANITFSGRQSTFDLYRQGGLLAPDVKLNIPGSHNISNAVGALALAHQLDLAPDLTTCAAALSVFTGVGRRFEIIGTASGITVIDDYAHHPTEIRATLEAAHAATEGRIICLFQPHRYTRTAAFFDDFARAFGEADQVFLHRVYGAGEAPLPNADSATLAAEIRRHSSVPVTYNEDITILEQQAATTAHPGDLIITMGAGDITRAAPRILTLLCQNNVPQ